MRDVVQRFIVSYMRVPECAVGNDIAPRVINT